ncbi:hypothetical protein TGCAST_388790 [Toxoplasma gondii CAST]|uniref:Uncharacterized protein n=1 Tax=Toxoplasma gondii CAST TaxID=943122 RepID=A0A425HTZ9_TOXGO|nr:hypothetical protein TGCAST_388790 [Toxoplasma gondii CAST]
MKFHRNLSFLNHLQLHTGTGSDPPPPAIHTQKHISSAFVPTYHHSVAFCLNISVSISRQTEKNLEPSIGCLVSLKEPAELFCMCGCLHCGSLRSFRNASKDFQTRMRSLHRPCSASPKTVSRPRPHLLLSQLLTGAAL